MWRDTVGKSNANKMEKEKTFFYYNILPYIYIYIYYLFEKFSILKPRKHSLNKLLY